MVTCECSREVTKSLHRETYVMIVCFHHETTTSVSGVRLRVGSQITSRSNSHRLAPHSFSEIWSAAGLLSVCLVSLLMNVNTTNATTGLG